MNDDSPDPVPLDVGKAPARTVVLRWWSEQPDAEDALADRHTRGDIHELGGATLGIFASFEALVALLQQLVADSRRRRS